MISVALALLLLVGINQVFKTTAQTVGTSYAALESVRKQTSINNVFDRDFEAASNVGNTSQPAILITSRAVAQFWEAGEATADPDGNVLTLDLDDDGAYTSTGENVTGADLRSGRNHRLDSVSFFGRNLNVPFRRQTGDQKANAALPDTLVADESSTEAWIWYGFLRLPANKSSANLLPNGAPGGDFYVPAQLNATVNQNNFYARDFALGRFAVLLKSQPAGSYITSAGGGLAPLAPASQANAANPYTGSPWLMAHSRLDIAQGTIKGLHKLNWSSTAITDPNTGLNYPFNGKPWAEPNGDYGTELAGGVPFLARGVNHFIVEWAGDYVRQDATTGNIIGIGPDGILDYLHIPLAGSDFVRRTRWYGYPRNVETADDNANAQRLVIRGGQGSNPAQLVDVVPLRDVLQAAQNAGTLQTRYTDSNYATGGAKNPERILPSIQADYSTMASGQNYACAWGPTELTPATTTVPTFGESTPPPSTPGPWLIRIILNVRDGNNRLPDGTTIEHVYNLNR
jgi:hypothetical protein